MSDATSVGQLMLNEAVPEGHRQARYDFNKKSIHEFFQGLAERNPDQYRDTLKRLSDIGLEGGWSQGASVSLSALRKSAAKEKLLAPVRQSIEDALENPDLSDEDLDRHIISTLQPAAQPLQDAIMEEAKGERSPYYTQVASGGRGKASDLNSLRGADLLAQDHRGAPIPIPIWNSYAEGFDPAEMFAGAYSQRKSMIAVKLGTADAGYASKKLTQAGHRQVVTRETPEETRLPVGLPVKTEEVDNIGGVLAQDAGGLKAGTVLTSQSLEHLKDEGIEDILLHSPMTELSSDGGISRWAAGRRDRAGLAKIGDNVGITSGQTVGEKLSQGALGSKHASLGGAKTKVDRSGMPYLNRLLEGPEGFPEAGPLSRHSGTVLKVQAAPQGGHEVTVQHEDGPHTYTLNPGLDPTVKVGDQLEQGDDLSDGIPHPRELLQLRGLGQARKDYMGHLREALDNSGVAVPRRQLESIVTGLLGWAKVNDANGIGDAVVDDIVPANRLIKHYEARPDSRLTTPSTSLGRYLEEPALHYTPGTRVTKRVAAELQKWKIKDLRTHEEAPGFEPHWERSVMGLANDPDWQTRLQGFYTTKSFTEALHRGRESDSDSTSYVPALARGHGFGDHLATQGTYGGTPVPAADLIAPLPTAAGLLAAPPSPPPLRPAIIPGS